jgi:hypothetical protein
VEREPDEIGEILGLELGGRDRRGGRSWRSVSGSAGKASIKRIGTITARVGERTGLLVHDRAAGRGGLARHGKELLITAVRVCERHNSTHTFESMQRFGLGRWNNQQ